MELICKSLEDLNNAAQKLFQQYPQQGIFALYGEMGVGKTTFMNAICNYLQVIDTVQSPTFSIVNEYRLKTNDVIYHFDFYRIKNLNEVYDIGYEDYFYSGNYCFIEWAERIEELLPEETIKIYINENTEDKSRIFSF